MNLDSFAMKQVAAGVLAASSALSWTVPVAAQSGSADFRLEEVIVTARRREESLQNVPISINAVSGEAIEELNIRDFADMQAIIPGLTLEPSAIAGSASLRGVRYDAFANASGTVEFYMNDAATGSSQVLQAMYDIGRVEVLRGPQGTLRGKASPSGSITLSTRSPDLDQFGGEINVNADDEGGRRAWAALNLPLLEDTLAVRVTGLYDKNNGNTVESINTDIDPENKNEGARLSATFAPTDNLTFDFVYQNIDARIRSFGAVESANLADPSLPDSYARIKPGDRKGVTDIPRTNAHQESDIYNLRAEWGIGGATLYYVGQYVDYLSSRKQADDLGDFFDPRFGEDLQTFGQDLRALKTESQAQELRLQSDDPIFDRLDYVFGIFYTKSDTTNDLIAQTPIVIGLEPPRPGGFTLINETPITTDGTTEEKSIFGHLSWQLGDATELGIGTRFITYENDSILTLAGEVVDVATVDTDDDSWIYTLSLKHEFTDELMTYATVGTSWRPGNNVIGDFNVNRSELENSFLNLPAEDSISYELGMKSTWLDGTLRLNAATFYQEFEEYPYRVPGQGAFYVSTNEEGVETLNSFTFVGPVPVNVVGLELEGYYQPLENWYLSGTLAYAKSEIDNGFIPCNDYFPADGIPDTSGQIPTVEDIRNRTGGDNLTGCMVDGISVNFAPEWTGTVQSEYSFPVGDYELYLRGQASLYGDSDNDESNALDDVDAYGIVNLYTGIRDAAGKWEFMFYGNNIFDTERVLNRDATAATVGYQAVDLEAPGGPRAIGQTGVSGFRGITMTQPREFGINLRYSF